MTFFQKRVGLSTMLLGLTAFAQPESPNLSKNKGQYFRDHLVFQDFVLSGKEGATYTLKDQGVPEMYTRPYLVIAWAEWCGPCMAKMLLLAQWQKKLGEHIQIYPIAIDRPRNAKAIANLKAMGLSLYYSPNLSKLMQEVFQISSIPAMFLFSKNGTLISTDTREVTKIMSDHMDTGKTMLK